MDQAHCLDTLRTIISLKTGCLQQFQLSEPIANIATLLGFPIACFARNFLDNQRTRYIGAVNDGCTFFKIFKFKSQQNMSIHVNHFVLTNTQINWIQTRLRKLFSVRTGDMFPQLYLIAPSYIFLYIFMRRIQNYLCNAIDPLHYQNGLPFAVVTNMQMNACSREAMAASQHKC